MKKSHFLGHYSRILALVPGSPRKTDHKNYCVPNNMSHCRAGIPHGDGLIVYYVDDDEKRYNFTGVFDQGKPRGDSGTLHYRSGDVYQGGFSEEQLPQGKGTLR